MQSQYPQHWYYKYDIPHLILGVVSLVIFAGLEFAKPNPLYFPPNDSNSLFPHPGKSTIPTWLAIVLVAVIGIVTILVLFAISYKFPKICRKFNVYSALWNCAAVVGVSSILVDVLKNYVGRPRPDMIALCGENFTGAYSTCKSGVSKSAFNDNYRSWPSGHSSSAMSGFIYLALLIQKSLIFSRTIGTFIAALYILFALYIGATRIRDFKHHTDDVLAGFFIGYIISRLIWDQCLDYIYETNDKEHDIKLDNEDKSTSGV
ncbi:PAP2 superfamily protein [Trichomonas vaginalis G3]|uniref:PAP2 superfamily protein n=1 Tax=Trichomonas vaginalis (strain ATCC PRA-98 / G3) TaxID=412133 RepID=A2FWS2_TRIV3|nr:phosphatidate phosphatase protein [Trichomonas vaginalis G3]EAX90635.1 PAP2 superfamily protein [Trichomonas vaginalis G3]KAI5502843.1 phosphatidate phosphatase protein [Trichomonas vaginalis G3]|eukprot:XP_001303565.1 PAP2 superfamily protein [Trichomonas vaginalis G3]